MCVMCEFSRLSDSWHWSRARVYKTIHRHRRHQHYSTIDNMDSNSFLCGYGLLNHRTCNPKRNKRSDMVEPTPPSCNLKRKKKAAEQLSCPVCVLMCVFYACFFACLALRSTKYFAMRICHTVCIYIMLNTFAFFLFTPRNITTRGIEHSGCGEARRRGVAGPEIPERPGRDRQAHHH